eukprot:8694925-Alexandrium_andersonii.AAC.1
MQYQSSRWASQRQQWNRSRWKPRWRSIHENWRGRHQAHGRANSDERGVATIGRRAKCPIDRP